MLGLCRVISKVFHLFIIITLLRVYRIIPGLMALILFQGHRCVWKIGWKKRVLVHCNLNVMWLQHTLKKLMHTMFCVTGLGWEDILSLFFASNVSPWILNNLHRRQEISLHSTLLRITLSLRHGAVLAANQITNRLTVTLLSIRPSRF